MTLVDFFNCLNHSYNICPICKSVLHKGKYIVNHPYSLNCNIHKDLEFFYSGTPSTYIRIKDISLFKRVADNNYTVFIDSCYHIVPYDVEIEEVPQYILKIKVFQ